MGKVCTFWLAEREGSVIRLLDGCHDSPDGVATARAYHEQLGFARPGQDLVMVEITAVPDADPSIDTSGNPLGNLIRAQNRAKAAVREEEAMDEGGET